MKTALIFFAFVSSATAAAYDLTFQVACVASVCGKQNGSVCKEVVGQKLQPVTVQLKDPGLWPRRLFGNTTCSMNIEGVDLTYRVDVIVEPDKGGLINLIPSIQSK